MATVKQDLVALRGHLVEEVKYLDGEAGEAKRNELRNYLACQIREKELVIKAIDFALGFFMDKEES